MKDVVGTLNQKHTHWGFKDPRTCFLYPLWSSVLPEHKIVATYRPPQELWQRYRPNNFYNRYREPYRAWKFMVSWCNHNANILSFLKNTKQEYLVLDYRDLMSTQSEFDRLQDFVGVMLDDRRRKNLYRHRAKKESLILKLIIWLVYKKTGHHPTPIMAQLDTLRT